MKTTRHEEGEVTDWLCQPIKGRCPPWIKAAAAVLIVVGAAGWSAPSSAQSTIGTEPGVAEIERAFWVCDRAATINGIDNRTAITCGSLTEALLQRKFGGNFNAMLAWWWQYKEAAHLALAR